MKLIKSISILLILPILAILLLLVLKNINSISFLEGKILEINNKESLRPTILIENQNGLYSITFIKDINLKNQNINIGDTVYIKINSEIMESYPMQARGHSIMLLNKEEQ